MSCTCRSESDPRMVILGMSHKLISVSAYMSRLLIKGSAGEELVRGRERKQKKRKGNYHTQSSPSHDYDTVDRNGPYQESKTRS